MSQPAPDHRHHRPPRPTPAPPDAVSPSPSILVLGGTGLMGREVLGALRRRGVVPRVLVRDPARLDDPRGRRGPRRRPARPRLAAPRDARRRRRLPHLAARGRRGRAHPHRRRRLRGGRRPARLRRGPRHRLATPLLGWLVRRFYGLVLPRYRGKFAIGRMVEASATNPVIICAEQLHAERRGAPRRHPRRRVRAPVPPQGPQPRRPARRRGGGRRHPARPEHAVGHLPGRRPPRRSPARSARRCGPRPWAGRCATPATTTPRSRRPWPRTSPATATTTGSPRCASCAASRCTPPPEELATTERLLGRAAHRLHRVRPPRPRRALRVGCPGGCPATT